MKPCGSRAHDFFEIEELTHVPAEGSFDRVGILLKCANCGEERELWKGEEIAVRSPGSSVTDTPEADKDEHTMFITDAEPEE